MSGGITVAECGCGDKPDLRDGESHASASVHDRPDLRITVQRRAGGHKQPRTAASAPRPHRRPCPQPARISCGKPYFVTGQYPRYYGYQGQGHVNRYLTETSPDSPRSAQVTGMSREARDTRPRQARLPAPGAAPTAAKGW